MRLWHYKLIPYLPNEMLISQWRECIAIKRQWEKGTLKHRLVSYVMDYDKTRFFRYVEAVRDEMCDRKIKFQNKYFIEIMEYCQYDWNGNFELYPEHNNRYLVQCYYNLQEKYDRGIITKEEWEKINNCPDLFDVDVYDG